MSMKPAINAGSAAAQGVANAAAQGANIILQADEARAKRLSSIFDGIYRYQDRRDANLKFQKEMQVKDKDLALKQGQLNYQEQVLKHEKEKHNEIWGAKNENKQKQSLGVQEYLARIHALRSGAWLTGAQAYGQNLENNISKMKEEVLQQAVDTKGENLPFDRL